MAPQELMHLALRAARAAAEVHRREAGGAAAARWSEKGTFDFVSEVDREAERQIVATVRAACPSHAFLTEEGTVERTPLAQAGGPAQPEWLWVVDPLDGTTNYLHRYPMHAASVAALHRGEPVAGAVVASASGEEWTAWRGGGAFRNGEAVQVSDVRELKNALIGTGFPFRVPDRIPAYLKQFEAVLRSASGVRRAGSAALDLCHVASGWLDGFWELSLATWDIAAGILIVREAGGLVTSLDGAADVLRGGSVLAGNPHVQPALGRLVLDAAR